MTLVGTVEKRKLGQEKHEKQGKKTRRFCLSSSHTQPLLWKRHTCVVLTQVLGVAPQSDRDIKMHLLLPMEKS